MPDPTPLEIDILGPDPLDVPSFYANSVQVMQGPYDVTLTFRHIFDLVDGTAQGKTVARVAMSPQHAKALVAVLMERVALYEQKFGQLPSRAAMEGEESEAAE